MKTLVHIAVGCGTWAATDGDGSEITGTYKISKYSSAVEDTRDVPGVNAQVEVEATVTHIEGEPATYLDANRYDLSEVEARAEEWEAEQAQ